MRILGIDPGTRRIGYGLIEKGVGLTLLDYGVIEVVSRDESARAKEFAGKFRELIQKSNPDLAGVEKLYFARNRKTALAVAEACGVIIHLLVEKQIPVKEYRPGDIKQTLTNYSLSDKTAVAKMVKKILKINDLTGYDDASDALAIAITTAYYHNPWSKKINDNKERI